MLNEKSDVYSFGILIMEIISGRNPVDYSQAPGEVNLLKAFWKTFLYIPLGLGFIIFLTVNWNY